MILTFDGEFEKVHYPLPLAYCEEPDIQSMFTTFQRLQGHIQMNQTTRSGVAGGGGFGAGDLSGAQSQRYNTMQDFFQIEMENESMRSQILDIQSNFTAKDHEYLEIAQRKAYAETEYENYRQSTQSEIGRLIENVKDKEIELARLQEQLYSK